MVIAGNDRFRQIMFYFGRGFDRAAELGAKALKMQWQYKDRIAVFSLISFCSLFIFLLMLPGC